MVEKLTRKRPVQNTIMASWPVFGYFDFNSFDQQYDLAIFFKAVFPRSDTQNQAGKNHKA